MRVENEEMKRKKNSGNPGDIGSVLTAASIGAGLSYGVISVSISVKQLVTMPPFPLVYFLRNMGNKATLAMILYIWAVVLSLIYLSLKWKPFYHSAFILTLLSTVWLAILSIYYPVRLYVMAGWIMP